MSSSITASNTSNLMRMKQVTTAMGLARARRRVSVFRKERRIGPAVVEARNLNR